MKGGTSRTSTPRLLHSRGLLLAFLVAMTAIAAWGFARDHELLRTSGTDMSELEEPSDFIEDLLDEFGYESDQTLLVVTGDDLFRPDAVRAVRQLARALTTIDGVRGVLSLDQVPRTGLLAPPIPVLPPEGSSIEEFQRAREIALRHPLIAGHLSALDGGTWLLPISLDLERYWERRNAGESVHQPTELQAAVDSVSLPADMHASLTGTLMMASASREVFKREQILYHSIAYVLVFVLAAFLFRGFWAVIITGGGPVIGVFWTFGWLKILGMDLSSLTLILLPVMIMMIGFTDSVHLMVHIRRERSSGLSPFDATASALRQLTLPCFLTSLTTGLGFASLLIARTDLVRDFGLACAVGVVCTFLSVLSFLPFFASSYFGRYIGQRESMRLVDRWTPIAEAAFAWILKHSRAITVVGCALTPAALVYSVDLETENRVSADIPEGVPAAQALIRIDEAMGGSVPMSIVVGWSRVPDAQPDAILSAIRDARAAIEVEDEHSAPFDVTNLIAFLGQDSRETNAWPSALPLLPAQLTERVFHPETFTAQVEVRVPDKGYRHFEPMFARIDERLVVAREHHPGFDFQLAGQAALSGLLYEQFTEDLMNSLAYAALTIFVILTFAFRSIRLGLISIIPNAFPLAATASILVFLDWPMAGATAFVMSLGIAVDDTIHFMTRFRHEFQQDGNLDEAVRRTTVRVGKALTMTTVVLVVGFASVLTSDFPRNRMFSGMVCITLLSALACDLVLLPAMLKTFGPGKKLLRATAHQTRRTRNAQ